MNYRDLSELETALSVGCFEKSTMGPILDRLELFSLPPFQERVRPEDITARPTAEARHQAKSEPDTRLLEVYGRASRKLAKLAALDPEGAAALVAFHGDAGAKWGRGEFGRIGSILHLTQSGRKLVRKTRARGAKLKLTDEQRLETEVGLQALKPSESREALLSSAITEAQALYERALAKWAQANAQ